MLSPDLDDSVKLIHEFLPKYLSPELTEELFAKIKENFPKSRDAELLFTQEPEIKHLYQGDGFFDIPFPVFIDGAYNLNYQSGVILSNTCDVSTENRRITSPNIQFSVIYSLEDYVAILEKNQIHKDRIISFKNDLRSNQVSNLFYLPEKKVGDEVLLEESFVRFDYTASIPLDKFEEADYEKNYAPGGDRIFTFSNYGFYVFLLKLSIHFCRIREGVFRNN